MARSRRKDASSGTSGNHAKTTSTKTRKQVSQDQDAFGEDPWTSMSGRSDAAIIDHGTPSFTAVNKTKDTKATAPRVKFMTPLGVEEQQDASKTTPKPACKAVEDPVEDDIAIPTPIHQTFKVKLVAEDGREAYCYQPISGFEHLFKPPPVSKATSKTDGGSSAMHVADQPQAAPAGKSEDNAPTVNSIDRQCSMRDASPIRNLSNSAKAEFETSSSSSLRKRTRANARSPQQSPDVPDKKPCLGGNSDDDDEDVKVVMESSKTFLMGDILGLKTFFRHRLDELTMKPVRGMVTRWVKQLEPKRKGVHGPYHKKLPTKAPKDATPPWWPETVPYVEPAHLDKDALLTLAVDIMLQHRDTRADELKRQQPWTNRLRQVAEAEVSLTDSDQFSSSKNPAFSSAMKERAEKELLPSLFDVMHSYEDFVHQHSLWTYPDTSKAPIGKSITWRSIPRPPTQTGRFKRPRPAPQPAPTSFVALDFHNGSGDETEEDDTMVRLMKGNSSFKQLVTEVATVLHQNAKAARRKSRADTARPMPVTPMSVVDDDTVAPPPMTMKQGSPLLTPQPVSSEMEDVKPLIGIPFEDSMTQFRAHNQSTPVQMIEDQEYTPQSITKCTTMPAHFQAPRWVSYNQPTVPHDEDDAKAADAAPPAFQAQRAHLVEAFSHSPQQYQTVLPSIREHGVTLGRPNQPPVPAQEDNVHTFGALSTADSFNSLESSSFNSFEPSPFAPYAVHTFNDSLRDITMFNQQYPGRGNQSFFSPPLASHNNGYGSSSDLLYTSMDSPMTNLSSQAEHNFNGLPYDFAGAQH